MDGRAGRRAKKTWTGLPVIKRHGRACPQKIQHGWACPQKNDMDRLARRKTTWTGLSAEKKTWRVCGTRQLVFFYHKLMSSYNFYPQNNLLRKGQTDQTRPQFMNEWTGRREKYMGGLDREKITGTGNDGVVGRTRPSKNTTRPKSQLSNLTGGRVSG